MKNLQKGSVVPVLLVIIALLVVGGGVYVYENKKAEVPATVDVQTSPVNTQKNTVEYPKNGDILQKGQSYEIKWSPVNSSETVNITLLNEVARPYYHSIAKSYPDTGKMVWKVPSGLYIGDLPSMGDFVVNIEKTGQPIWARSGKFIIIEPSTLIVLSPNGGESYRIGSQQVVKWSAPASVQTVRIFLESISTHYAGGGVGGYIPDVHKILAQDAPNSGSFAVNIPDVPSGKYKVLIEGIDNSGKPVVLSDSSDNSLTVTN